MPILVDDRNKVFSLKTANTTYAFRVNEAGQLVHCHWGGRLDRIEDVPKTSLSIPPIFHERDYKIMLNEEFPGWGGYFFDESALKVLFADGVRDLVLVYDGFEVKNSAGRDELFIRLKDIRYPLSVHLHYNIYDGLDLIDRKAVIANVGDLPVTLETAFSATWYVPKGYDYRLTHLSGMWLGEFQRQRTNITQASMVLESRRGQSGHDAAPWFALDHGNATEESGKVWYGAIHWSGNWKIVIEKNHLNQTKVSGGINHFDFSWTLRPGETFETPVFTGGYTTRGFGEMSRNFHKYQLEHLRPKALEKRSFPIDYNTWEYEFDIDQDKVMKLVDLAADTGYEMFVIDDGWFGGRDNADAGLGDWWPSKTRFSRGLKPIIDKVKARGMLFGIWVEPEMVNPDSDLYRAHPEWTLHFPNRKSSTGRGQLVLNLAIDEVREFSFRTVDDLLTENPGINYIKWDMNRYFSEPGWPAAAPEDQKSVWTRYVLNLYNIWGRLKARHPEVIFLNCASGGGRVDLGLAKFCDCEALTDSGDVIDRIRIFEGFTYVHPPQRLGGAGAGLMAGMVPLGYDKSIRESLRKQRTLLEMDADDLDRRRDRIAHRKKLRDIVAHGDFYRLSSAFDSNFPAYMYVSKDRRHAVVAASGYYMQFRAQPPKLLLKGLDPIQFYEVEGFGEMSGRALMENGLDILFQGTYDSRLIWLRAIVLLMRGSGSAHEQLSESRFTTT